MWAITPKVTGSKTMELKRGAEAMWYFVVSEPIMSGAVTHSHTFLTCCQLLTVQ